MEVKTGRGDMRQFLSLSILDQAHRSALGLVSDHDGSNVPLLSLLMVYLLTGSFPVGLRIPRISPILAETGVSIRFLWAMLIPVHLRGWELSSHSHPTSQIELSKPASFVC